MKNNSGVFGFDEEDEEVMSERDKKRNGRRNKTAPTIKVEAAADPIASRGIPKEPTSQCVVEDAAKDPTPDTPVLGGNPDAWSVSDKACAELGLAANFDECDAAGWDLGCPGEPILDTAIMSGAAQMLFVSRVNGKWAYRAMTFTQYERKFKGTPVDAELKICASPDDVKRLTGGLRFTLREDRVEVEPVSSKTIMIGRLATVKDIGTVAVYILTK